MLKTITPEMRQFPMQRFAVMASLDGSAGLLGTIGGAGCAGQVRSTLFARSHSLCATQLQTLIGQSGIPMTMAFSALALQTRYVARQYIGERTGFARLGVSDFDRSGALLIVIGALFGMAPQLFALLARLTSGDDADSSTQAVPQEVAPEVSPRAYRVAQHSRLLPEMRRPSCCSANMGSADLRWRCRARRVEPGLQGSAHEERVARR